MANNFYNKIVKNVSADSNAPSEVYAVPASKKTIVIELDVANRSTSSQTISVEIEDFDKKGSAVTLTNSVALGTSKTLTKAGHGLSTGDRIQFTHVTGLSGPALLKQYWVINLTSATFQIATSHANAIAGTPITVTGTQSSSNSLNSLYFVYVVRDAPIPVGGALKVIAGQKLVIEAQDKLYCTASSANSVDAIASILEDVS